MRRVLPRHTCVANARNLHADAATPAALTISAKQQHLSCNVRMIGILTRIILRALALRAKGGPGILPNATLQAYACSMRATHSYGTVSPRTVDSIGGSDGSLVALTRLQHKLLFTGTPRHPSLQQYAAPSSSLRRCCRAPARALRCCAALTPYLALSSRHAHAARSGAPAAADIHAAPHCCWRGFVGKTDVVRACAHRRFTACAATFTRAFFAATTVCRHYTLRWANRTHGVTVPP